MYYIQIKSNYAHQNLFVVVKKKCLLLTFSKREQSGMCIFWALFYSHKKVAT